MADIVVPDQDRMEVTVLRDSDILNPDFDFDDKIAVATKVATSLRTVIENQELAVQIGKDKKTGEPNMYVTAEGWEVLGTMLGCTPYVEEVIEIPAKKGRFTYQATVSIRHGDTVLSRASAIAERNDRQRERPFVYSMAQTRALGKAYRMALSWIIKMAGYQPTPAEEMPRFKPDHVVEAEVRAKVKPDKKEEPVDAPIVEKQNNSFTTAAEDKGPLTENPVVVTYAKNVAQELISKGRKITKRSMLLKARGMVKRGEIPEEYCQVLADFIRSNCPE